jgi:hypothetical protein
MTDKLSIQNEMLEFDRKNRKFFDELVDDEQRKFSPFLMIRWGSSVVGDADLQAYYLMSTNERLNRNFFDVNSSKHKKLQWLLATTVSPGLGPQRHQWISPKKKDSSDNKTIKFLRELRPDLKEDEIRLLAKINDRDDIKDRARELGWTDQQLKSDL